MKTKDRVITQNIVQMYEDQQKQRIGYVKELVKELEGKVLYVNEYSYKEYKETIDRYYELIKEGFEYDWYRHAKIPFRLQKDGELYTLRFTHFITHAIMWSLLKRVDSEIREEHIFDGTKVSQKIIKNFIDEYFINAYRGEISNRKMNRYIHDMTYKLSRIPNDFNDVMSLTISMETFIDIINRLPRVKEITQTRIGDTMQPSEIENLLDSLTVEQLDIIANDPEYNDLKPLILSGQGIKKDQFKEFAVNGGLKPDLVGNTIPIPVDTNLITDGLNKVSYYYIDAKGGRKSLIMNSTTMGNSGHFARMLMLLTSDFKLSGQHDCGTLHTANIEIRDKYYLKRLRGRKYRLPIETRFSTLKVTDTHLIGENIRLRTPALCSTAPMLCDTCYGELVHTNNDLNSVGGLAATTVSEPISQKILSSKHLLATISELIEFDNLNFDKYLMLVSNEIMIRPDFEDTKAKLLIKRTDIKRVDDADIGELGRYTEKFYIKMHDGTMIEFKEEDDKELFLSDETEDLVRELSSRRGRRKVEKDEIGYIVIPLSEIDPSERIFQIEISNNELTKPLHEIMGLINHTEIRKVKGVETVDDMISGMLDLMETSEISSHSIHSEIIISALLRSKSDPYSLERPDFNSYIGINDVEILTMKRALTLNPSITVSLAFQEIRQQLLRPSTYLKTGSSYLDPLFRKRLNSKTES